MDSSPRRSFRLASRILSLAPLHARFAVLGAAAALTWLFLLGFGSALRTFEESIGDFGWLLNPSDVPEERINVVAIDEESIAALGPWPWPRETLAQLSNTLTDAGVELQLYDVVFSEEKPGDEAFVAALTRTNSVLSQVPALTADSGEPRRIGRLTHPIAGLSCAEGQPSAQGFVAQAAAFSEVPKGHVARQVPRDGAARHVPAYICVDGEAYPSLALSALLVATGTDDWSATVRPGAWLSGPAQVLTLDAYPGIEIPLDADGNMRVSYRKTQESFSAFPASAVLAGTIEPAWLDGTWALIGYTAFGLDDIVPTPFDGAAPGVEVHARLLASVLDNDLPFTPRAAPLYLALLSALFAGALLWCATWRERFANSGLALATALLPLCAVLLHGQLLSSANVWLGWLMPAVYGVIAGGLMLVHEYARVRLERGRVLDNLSSYLPVEVAHEIAYSLPNSSIDARRQNVTLLCADLRNFSAYGEARPPEESAALLHYFFSRTTALIEQHHGRVHEFKGDSLLALWDGSDAVTAQYALQAAHQMQQAMEDVLPQSPPSGLEPLALGIGIEQGPVLIGSIGPAHRRTHTLLGETVTIALRIQDMTAELAQPILIGECAARQLSDARLESQGSFLLAGLRTPHTLFAPPLPFTARSKHSNPALKLLHGGRN